ncbi:hypothetical protein FOL47_010456 [Perkinsus chesapeaki]|uniref:Aluminum-activated malate transporter 1 n=1 Tax=Perkinsus chesapeaki TaxID=330153 RepID=A0A7J6MPL7_PERCH|nr:hypothetical protein FOL47_010456 [Perkinsus chesapeaki]
MHIPLLHPLNAPSLKKGHGNADWWGLTPRSIAELQTAIFTGVTVCLTSTTVFNSTISFIFPPQFMILGLAGALIVSYLEMQLAVEWSLKTTIASWLGCACGCLIVYVVPLINQGEYNPYFGLLLAVPFSFLLSLADQAGEVYCKLSSVYRGDKALLLLIIPVVFGGDDPYWSAITAAIGYTVGSAIPLLGTSFLWSLGVLPDTRAESLRALSLNLADYFDEVASLRKDRDHQVAVLRRMWSDLYKASTEAATSTSDLKLRGLIWSMVACLSTVRRSSRRHACDPVVLERLWLPFEGSVVSLRQKVICTLRMWETFDESDTKIADAAGELLASVEHFITDCEVPSGPELTNFEFTVNEMVKFSLLAQEFLIRVKGPQEGSCMHKVVDWLRQPLFAPASPGTTWRVRFAYPLRAAVTVPLVALFILIGGEHFDVLAHYGLWMILPCVFCFLPTPGASIRKGLRRILGTVVASVLAVACVCLHPNNDGIFLCELFFFSVIAKLMFFHDTLQYSGLVFGFTWIIVGLGPGIDTSLPVGSKVVRAVHRMDMTVAGVILSILLASLIFPIFANKRLRRATARSLELVSNSVANACESLVHKTPWNREALSEDVLDAAVFLAKSYADRNAQIADARAECQALRYLSPTRHHELAHVVAAQHLLDRLTRQALAVISAVTTCLATIPVDGCGLPKPAEQDLLLTAAVIRRRAGLLVAGVRIRKFKITDVTESVMRSIDCLESNIRNCNAVEHYGMDCLVHALQDFAEVWEEVERMVAKAKDS